VSLPAKIQIDSLELHGFHGWHQHEGQFGQHFLVDIEMETDIEAAARTDQLVDALDYGAVIAATRRLFSEKRYHMLEAVAVAVARGLLAEFAKVETVRIRVKKLAPPVPERLAFAAVEVLLARSDPHG
jgi:7,8-dihydroneopterin aldolase/epimerase/oxygenase